MLRDLNSDEKALIENRRLRFDLFLAERMPVLTDFMLRLELPNPAMVLVEADKYLAALDEWLRDQHVDPNEKTWLVTRLGYFIGEYLVQRLDGCWNLNEIPDSRYFGRFVVGSFSHASNQNAMIDPFVVADACIAEPPGR
jgi:hypothetical protein